MRDKWQFLRDYLSQPGIAGVFTIKGLVPMVKLSFPNLANMSDYQLYQLIYREYNKIRKANSAVTITYSTNSVPYTYSYTPKKEIVGIIGDTHEPFTHPEYRNFCVETFKKYGVTKVVHIGDEVDNHALSYHEKNSEAMSAMTESERAQAAMNEWYKAFPEVTVIVGNHGALPHRKATTAGIPRKFIKTYEQIWEAPPGWKWEMDVVIDNVLYTHGIGCTSSPTGAVDKAIRSRQSVVIGHLHSFGGVNYHASNNDLIFGLNVGCGIDVHSYAFEYGKNFNNKPTLGCGIVMEGHDAIFVPMNLGSKYVLS